MTPEEREALKNEIVAEISEQFKGIAIQEDVQGVLSDVRNKWFRDCENSNRYTGSVMFNLFGAVTYWKVWELIRKLVCLICGVGYVRQLGSLNDRERINRIAEILCQTVYDLREEFVREGAK